MRFFRKSIVAAAVAFCSVGVLFAGVNHLASGLCSNGRTWWSNTEYNEQGKATCVVGMDCNGSGYTLGCGTGNPIQGWTIAVSNQSGSVHLTPNHDAVIVIFNSQTGAVVYSSGSAISSSSGVTVSTSGWSAGPYIAALYDPNTMIYTGDGQFLLY